MDMSEQLVKYPRLVPKSKKELCAEFECCRETIRAMCHDIGIVTNRRLTVHQVRKFYDEYGVPGVYRG
jgi:hypothetical protein